MGQPGYVLQEAQKHEPKIAAQVEEEQRRSALDAGKRAHQVPLDPMQSAKGDPFTLALRAENAQLKARLAQLEAPGAATNKTATINVGIGQTPMYKNIATPPLGDNTTLAINGGYYNGWYNTKTMENARHRLIK